MLISLKQRAGVACGWVFISLALVLTFITVMDVEAATRAQIKAAIEKGVTWLVGQQNPDGSWGTRYQVAETAFAVKKLEHYCTDKKYGLGLSSPFDPRCPFCEEIEKGFRYIFSNARIIPIGTQVHDGRRDDPDTDRDGVGVYFVTPGGHLTYETGIVLMAIAESRAPDRIVDAPGSPIDGWTYYKVAEDTVNYLTWGQTDTGYGRGGWDYSHNNNSGPRSDNSNTGYALLGLLYAQAKMPEGFEIDIPSFVADELNIWVNHIQCPDGGSAYTGCPGSNPLRTGNLLMELAFVGDVVGMPRVEKARRYLCNNWPISDDYNDYQEMYILMRGFLAQGMAVLECENLTIDWQDEFDTTILNQQNDDGSWTSCKWGDPILCTEWALLTLERAVIIIPPRPCRGVLAATALFSELELLENELGTLLSDIYDELSGMKRWVSGARHLILIEADASLVEERVEAAIFELRLVLDEKLPKVGELKEKILSKKDGLETLIETLVKAGELGELRGNRLLANLEELNLILDDINAALDELSSLLDELDGALNDALDLVAEDNLIEAGEALDEVLLLLDDASKTRSTMLELIQSKRARILQIKQDLFAAERVCRRRPSSSPSVGYPLSAEVAPIPLAVVDIRLHPNPVRIRSGRPATFEVKGQGIEGLRVKVFDLSGRVVFDAETSNGLTSLVFDGLDQRTKAPLANGVYLYVVTVKGWNGELGRAPVQKLVILR